MLLLIFLTGVQPAPAWAVQIPMHQLQAEWRIGTTTGSHYDLDDISALAIDASGTVYVGQSQERAVRVFDSNGRYLRTIGGAGFGPGELQSVAGLWIGPDGQLIVSDYARQIVAEYSSGGTFMRQWDRSHIRRARTFEVRGPLGLAGDGVLIYHDVPSSDDWQQLSLRSAGPNGDVLIAQLTTQNPAVPYRSSRISATMSRPIVWGAKWYVYPAGMGILIVDIPLPTPEQEEAFFRVSRVGPSGDTSFTRSFRYTPGRVPKSMADSISRARLSRVKDIARMSGESEQALLRVYEEVFSAEQQRPPVTDVVISLDGQVWLKEFLPSDGSNIWLVLDRSGRLLHKVRVPGGWKVSAVSGNQVVATATGSQGVPQIVKARVQPERR